MKTVELKERLIEEIKEMADIHLLENLFAITKADKEEEVYELNEEQIAAIEESREEYRKGNHFSHEEIVEEFQKWSEEPHQFTEDQNAALDKAEGIRKGNYFTQEEVLKDFQKWSTLE